MIKGYWAPWEVGPAMKPAQSRLLSLDKVAKTLEGLRFKELLRGSAVNLAYGLELQYQYGTVSQQSYNIWLLSSNSILVLYLDPLGGKP